MRNLLFYPLAYGCFLLSLLFSSCGDNVFVKKAKGKIVEIERVAVPVCAVPVFDASSFGSKVYVEFSDAGVELSALPVGVTLESGGKDILLRSHVPGVEYVVSGVAADASFAIASDFSPLVTLNGLSLTAHGRNALQVSSKELIYVRSDGSVIADVAGAEKADKLSAAVKFMGRTLLCGGTLSVNAGRRSAVFCTDTLFVAGMQLSLVGAPNSALQSNGSVVLSSGSLNAVSAKDVVKCKSGDFLMLGGELAVRASLSKADGIQANNIYVSGGNVEVSVTGAAADGIKAKGNLVVDGGNISVRACGGALFNEKKCDYSSASCIKCNAVVDIRGGNCSLKGEGDGTKGISCDSVLIVSGGNLCVLTKGGDVNHMIDVNAHASSKGVKSDGAVYLLGGNVEVVVLGEGERSEGVEAKRNMYVGGNVRLYVYAYDDALNAADLTVAGGRVFLYSVANDGADSNGALRITGGTLVADGSSVPEQGVDVDDFSLFTMSGGTLVSVGGASGPSPALPLGEGTTVPVAVWTNVDAVKGEYLSLSADEGGVLYAYKLARDIERGTMLVASEEIKQGGEYLFALSAAVGGADYCGNGLYAGGVLDTVRSSVAFDVVGAINCVADDGKVSVFEPGGDFSFGMMPPPPPPHAAGAAPGQGAFPPPPPARIFKSEYGENNLPNYD